MRIMSSSARGYSGRRELATAGLVLAVLLCCLVTGGRTSLAGTDVEGLLPAGRRFHARFVVDRIRPPSTDSRDGTATTTTTTTSSTTTTNTPTSRCREGCLQKRSIKDILCTQQRDCSMCWDVCNRNNQIRRDNALAHRLLLSLGRMIRNESVVTADIEWTTPAELVRHQPVAAAAAPSTTTVSNGSDNVERLSRIARDGTEDPRFEQQQQQQYHQCLVSWEISGGGLTGNLLTETFKVELSLWPNTKYHVHVTCRNKVTDSLIRSASLLVDTSDAIIVSLHGTTTTTPEVTSTEPEPPSESWRRRHWPFGAAPEADDGEVEAGEVLAVVAPSYGTSKEILMLGAFVALLVLLLLSLTVVLVVRRKPPTTPDTDRELLIEGRRPPLTPVTHLPPKSILHV
ncbi:transmembrane protein fend-like [Anopheles darlingi]|uniref:transmembrane protein fend-like n=1 Tax=Anopheles darlingi TaxID=43151 RepID=UPI0021000363|nr:transmembrane protein fend-like [Anopheles darlingi]